MKTFWNTDTVTHVGETVTVYGWIHVRRDMGKIAFVDLRDRSGILQVVLVPAELDEASVECMNNLRPEYVVEITGVVQARGERQINAELATGTVELLAKKINILATSQTPPFEIDNEDRQASEELRMQYRYLDLRHERMKENLILRHDTITQLRSFLNNQSFIEIETPILSKSTPEGARDYLVPSRNYAGNFYALPQSPQQYKQLLMAGGMQRYYQIARCFRDEDTRKDRQPEFTQLDIEVSFVSREDVMQLIEQMILHVVRTVRPEAVLTSDPIPRMTYQQAMEQYGTDRPDVRKDPSDPNELAFVWVIDFPFFEKTDDGTWTFTHNPFSAPMPEHTDALLHKQAIGDIIASQYDIVLNGYEIGGGSIRAHTPAMLRSVFEILGMSERQITEQFGHMLEAFTYGTPPHGGIAFGLDRLVSILANEYASIREVIAFPKTADGKDLLMNGPASVTQTQLDELHIALK